MAKYGMPYQGSKQAIADELIKQFPKADHFYDLFGGGGSISHAMVVNRAADYRTINYNEIDPLTVQLLRDAISGKYNSETFKLEWISREEFFKRKDSDGLIRTLYSFASGHKTYLYGKDIEDYKKSIHKAVVFGEFDELAARELGFSSWPTHTSSIEERRLLARGISVKLRLISLEMLARLNLVAGLRPINITNFSYDQVPILDGAIIYCDPPYAGTENYGAVFNTKKFLDWADNCHHPVYISEYNIKDSRFTQVWEISKRQGRNSGGKSDYVIEKLYVNQAGLAKL